MCWQSRKAIPGYRCELNAFALCVWEKGHSEEEKVKGYVQYTISIPALYSLTFKERILSNQMLLNLMRSVQRKVYGLEKLL